MKVLVTGATGFVGGEIIRQLHAAGPGIRILVRSPDSPRVKEAISCWGAEVQVGDVLDAASIDTALDRMDAVIHLVGIISEVCGSTFERVHLRGTANMIAAAQIAGVRRFIHMSALGTRPNAASRYHQSKWAAEEIVRHSGLDYTIFRPSIIYGPEDKFINLFARIIHLSPVVPLIGSPRSRFQPVCVRTVAAAFVQSLTQPRSVGQTYDLCGPEALLLSEIVDQIMYVVQRRRFKFQVPLGLAVCQAVLLEFICRRLLRRGSPLSRDQLIMLQEDNVGNPQPADELFELPPVPLRAGIAEYLRP